MIDDNREWQKTGQTDVGHGVSGRPSGPKKVLRRVSDVLFALVVLALLAILVSVLLAKVNGKTPEVFGYRLYVVESASMAPTLDVGSMILSRRPPDPTALSTRDIVTFTNPDGLTVTHRIIEVVHPDDGSVYYRTKGDNPINAPDPDLLDPQDICAVFVLKLPVF